MLRVARVTDPTGRYYLADNGVELGVVELRARDLASVGLAPGGSDRRRGSPWQPSDGATPGEWLGTGAAGLGLRGSVDAASLAAVLSGAHPFTGRPLRRHEAAVKGFDLTFAAPKSVSIAYGLGDSAVAGEVLAAHREAVGEAVAYVARRGAAVRRGTGGERRPVPVDGIVAASFTHATSRALDPHLHTHVVVANVARGADGRWSALDGRGLHVHALACGALYDAHVRSVLTERLGAEWTARRSGAYELGAVDPLLVGVLSSRRAEIRGHLHGRARPSSPGIEGVVASIAASRRGRAVAWAATRDAGAVRVDPDALRQAWRARAADVGVTAATLARDLARGARSASLPPPGAGQAHADVDEHRFAAALAGTVHSSPTRRDVVAAWAGAIVPGARAAAVERCVDSLTHWEDVVGVAEPPHRAAEVVAAPHLLAALGPRPSDPAALETWRAAAAAVDGYRSRWPLAEPWRPLGCAGRAAALSTMPARRLAEHVAVERQVAEARHRLGRGIGRAAEPPQRTRGLG